MSTGIGKDISWNLSSGHPSTLSHASQHDLQAITLAMGMEALLDGKACAIPVAPAADADYYEPKEQLRASSWI